MPSEVAFAVPLVKNGEEMPQIILDLRTSKVLSKWKSVTILYDSTLGMFTSLTPIPLKFTYNNVALDFIYIYKTLSSRS